MTDALAVEKLTKRFGSTTAVDELSFSVPMGRVVGFLGPNGAGKTTTLRSLLGLVAPSSGRALVQGRPYRALEDPVRTVGAVLEPAYDGTLVARGIAIERVGELAAWGNVVLHELTPMASTLEDVFLSLTGDTSLQAPS